MLPFSVLLLPSPGKHHPMQKRESGEAKGCFPFVIMKPLEACVHQHFASFFILLYFLHSSLDFWTPFCQTLPPSIPNHPKPAIGISPDFPDCASVCIPSQVPSTPSFRSPRRCGAWLPGEWGGGCWEVTLPLIMYYTVANLIQNKRSLSLSLCPLPAVLSHFLQ